MLAENSVLQIGTKKSRERVCVCVRE